MYSAVSIRHLMNKLNTLYTIWSIAQPYISESLALSPKNQHIVQTVLSRLSLLYGNGTGYRRHIIPPGVSVISCHKPLTDHEGMIPQDFGEFMRENYGSKSVPSEFENKKPLNYKQGIFMH